MVRLVVTCVDFDILNQVISLPGVVPVRVFRNIPIVIAEVTMDAKRILEDWERRGLLTIEPVIEFRKHQFLALGARVLPVYLDEVARYVNMDGGLRYTKAVIAVVDTGIDDNHEMLKGKVIEHIQIAPGSIHGPGAEHGTHVAGIIAGRTVYYEGREFSGILPNAELIDIKALDDTGWGSTEWILQALDVAIEKKPDAINMSLGGMNFCSPAFNRALKACWENGIAVICSAGNSGPSYFTVSCPGNSPYAISIGSVSMKLRPGRPSLFSSRGPSACGLTKPDILAPGGDIDRLIGYSLFEGVVSAKAGTEDEYLPMAGTSMAAPVATAVLTAIKKARGIAKVEEFEAVLRGAYGEKNNIVGYGILDAQAILEAAPVYAKKEWGRTLIALAFGGLLAYALYKHIKAG